MREARARKDDSHDELRNQRQSRHRCGTAALAMPKSVTLTILGWRKRPHACASRWKRARNCGSAAQRGAITFTATMRVAPRLRRQIDVPHASGAKLPVDPVFRVQTSPIIAPAVILATG